MKHRDELKKELESMAPFLAGMDKKPSFKVPEGYFEELPEKVMRLIRKEEGQPSSDADRIKVFSLSSWRKPLAVAASVMILIVAGYFILKPGSSTPSWSDISDEEVSTYISEHISEFDEGLFIQAVSLEGMDINFSGEVELSEEEWDPVMDELLKDIDLQDLETFL